MHEGLGRLPRIWRWATSNSSEHRPGGPAGRRGCARTSAAARTCIALLGRRRAPSGSRTAGTRPRPPPGAARRAGSGSSSRPAVSSRSMASQGRERARVVGRRSPRGSPAAAAPRRRGHRRASAASARAGERRVGGRVGDDRIRERDPVRGRSPAGCAGGDRGAGRRRRSAGCGSRRRARAPRSPLSGSRQRCAIAATATSAARQPSASRWSWSAAAASSSSASPKASSWNCWLTQLPTMSVPPG